MALYVSFDVMYYSGPPPPSGIGLNVSINKGSKEGEADIFTLGDPAH